MSESWGKFSALSFFELSWNCSYFKAKHSSILSKPIYQLPHPPLQADEELFARVSLGWNEDGLYIGCDAKAKEMNVVANDFRKGDSLEIFIDSRAVKSTGYLTKFCHHFLFFPDRVDGAYGKEITRFSADEIHPLADREDLQVTCQKTPSSYQMEVFLPSSVIYGYDPSSYDRLGFAYRVNRSLKGPQIFGGSEDISKIERHPSSWCEIALKKN